MFGAEIEAGLVLVRLERRRPRVRGDFVASEAAAVAHEVASESLEMMWEKAEGLEGGDWGWLETVDEAADAEIRGAIPSPPTSPPPPPSRQWLTCLVASYIYKVTVNAGKVLSQLAQFHTK